MKTLTTFILIVNLFTINAQVNYSTPSNGDLPKKLQDLPNIIDVQHFPKINDPVKIDNRYYWKHATSILCKEYDITIIEYGAYLFYNGKWNLRKTYPIKELDKTFGTKKQKLQQGEPYTWAKNWRIDERLFGGWAMWYFIGKTETGKIVCGFETIHTTNNLLN